jgi:Cu/Ag efflux pump CusA
MVLVSYLDQLVSDGMEVDEASVRGACLRLRPVLMTAATTALGLVPLLFSSGDGKIYVSDVPAAVRISTGERGESAV